MTATKPLSCLSQSGRATWSKLVYFSFLAELYHSLQNVLYYSFSTVPCGRVKLVQEARGSVLLMSVKAFLWSMECVVAVY